MKFISYHNGKQIPYWLGVLIGIDQALGALWPGADIDRTISHRMGVKIVKTAIRKGVVLPGEVMNGDQVRPFDTLRPDVQRRLTGVRIPFHRHPLEAVIDYFLDHIDPGHSLRSIGQ